MDRYMYLSFRTNQPTPVVGRERIHLSALPDGAEGLHSTYVGFPQGQSGKVAAATRSNDRSGKDCLLGQCV